MIERPERVHAVFSKICEVMIRLATTVQKRQRESGFTINQFSVSNCVVNMISPQMYRAFVFPYDRRIALRFERFGVHTCNWNVNPYVRAFQEFPNLGYLGHGHGVRFGRSEGLVSRDSQGGDVLAYEIAGRAAWKS